MRCQLFDDRISNHYSGALGVIQCVSDEDDFGTMVDRSHTEHDLIEMFILDNLVELGYERVVDTHRHLNANDEDFDYITYLSTTVSLDELEAIARGIEKKGWVEFGTDEKFGVFVDPRLAVPNEPWLKITPLGRTRWEQWASPWPRNL